MSNPLPRPRAAGPVLRAVALCAVIPVISSACTREAPPAASGPAGAQATAAASGEQGRSASVLAAPSATGAAERPFWFREVAREAGVDFRHEASEGQFFIIEEMGPGAALFDADGDGDLDLYLVQGGRIPSTEIGTPLPNRFYRNDGSGHFTDETDASGAGDTGYGMGVAAGDVDNDGDVDLYVTNVGPDVLLIGDGQGHFEDRTAAAGLGDAAFGSSAAFADYDGDGLLDLYVSVYIPWSTDVEQPCYDPAGERDYCNPIVYPPGQDRLYRNRGDGTFEDVTDRCGIGDHPSFGLGVVWADFDGDGRPDIYVANDHQPNSLWLQQGPGSFVESGTELGCAYNADGNPEAGMGIVCEDFDVDGDFDLSVTHFHGETNTLYRNHGGFFEDETQRTRFGAYGVEETSFGTGMFDADLDGGFEQYIASGAVMRKRVPLRSDNLYAERDRLLRLRPDGTFEDLTPRAGPAFEVAEMSRGAAFGDVDGDGDVDIVVANNRGPAGLLRNEYQGGNHWIALDLAGTRSNRSGIGAIVEVRAGTKRQRRQCCPQYSYQSSSERWVRFGLGAASRADEIVVHWPSGLRERWRDLPGDRRTRLEEGSGEALGAGATAASGATGAGAANSASDTGEPERKPEGSYRPEPVAPDPPSSEFAREVKRLADAGDLPGATSTAESWVEHVRAELSLDHPLRMVAIDTLARLYLRAKQARRTTELYEKSIQEYRDAGRAEHPAVAHFDVELAKVYGGLGRHDEAEALLRRTVEICDACFGVGSVQSTNARRSLSQFHLSRRRPDHARRVLDEAFEQLPRSEREGAVGADLQAYIGRIAQDQGHTLEAVTAFERARRVRAATSADDEAMAELVHRLGGLYRKLRDYNRAEQCYRQAVELRTRLHGEQDLRTATSIGQLGNVQNDRGDPKGAEQSLLRALRIFEKLNGPRGLYAVSTRRNLAAVYVNEKRYREAVEQFTVALEVFERELGAGAPATEEVRQNLAKTRRALEQQEGGR